MGASETPAAPRLDVRLHGGRAVSYALTGEFLVGGAVGCDLRLPGDSLPPVVCQFAWNGSKVFARRLADLPMVWNNKPLTTTEAIELRDGDRLMIGPVEITLSAVANFLHPKLQAVELLEVLPDVSIEEQARELEEDRRLWYARRQELEQELQRMRHEIAEHARNLKTDLATERRSLDEERQWQFEGIEQREADLNGREADLARREQQLRSEQQAFESAKESHKNDLLRFTRWQGTLEERQTLLDGRAAEIDERFTQLRRDAAELEDQVRLVSYQEALIVQDRERLTALKAEIDAQANKFTERAAQVEAQQAALAVLRAKLERQQTELRAEAEAVALEKRKQEEARREIDDRLRTADLLHAELGFLRDDHEQKYRAVTEQQLLVDATLADFRQQKDALSAAEAKLAEREAEIEERAAVTAEQAATLKAKLLQSLELQQRLEADRIALREREAAFAEAESARQALQDQLRKRAEELSGRGKTLDLTAREVAEEKAKLDAGRSSIDEWRALAEAEIATYRHELENRAAEIERQSANLTEREAALQRQVERIKDVGTTIAAERKALFEAKLAWDSEQSNQLTHKGRVADQVAELARQAPELEHRAAAAQEKLQHARDILRGHLAELHAFADSSRQTLLAEGDQLRQRERVLEQARAEHRHAVAEFRQQLLDWQATVAELRQSMNQNESRVGNRQADADALQKRLEETRKELSRREAEMREEQRIANEKRNEMERHLADMREWYRNKLRALAAGQVVDDGDMPAWDAVPEPRPVLTIASDDDPADQRLGELLRTRGLLDDQSLLALGNEARRQRKSLRQTLLASGIVTLYQLALIEAGNLDGLSIGRFRVIDRVRATSREQAYRVYDPKHPNRPSVLRLLAEGDEVQRAEYRQRFAAAAQAQHANLVNVYEVLELQGRSAVLTEWVAGISSSDWPPLAATPGIWLKLAIDAASALAHVHELGLVHGRVAAESFLLAPDGTLKLAGLGEPAWLTGQAAIFEPHAAGDLRAFGRVAYAWSQIGSKRRGARTKPFPAELAAIIRRLESHSESAMDDIIPLERHYTSATELLDDLMKLNETYPCPAETWTKLLNGIRGVDDEPLRQTA